ncbi:MAG: hypothetical protein ACYTFQ_17935, partial [Planctomycetota bacterium]
MKHHVVAVLLLSILFLSCKRKGPEDAAKAPSPSAGESNTESGVEMAGLKGGRSLMGDEEEIDATPHEVVLSPFYVDKHL